MIRVTRINGEGVIVNASLIELIEATPDTMITLATGRKTLVKETVDQVIGRVVEYEASVSTAGRSARRASLVSDPEALEDGS